jgi:hypothetical protein
MRAESKKKKKKKKTDKGFRKGWTRVVDLLASWKGRFGRHCIGVVGNAVPLCVMWIIWQERNACTFEGIERSVVELKLFFLRTLFEWMAAFHAHLFTSFFGVS